MVGGSEKILSFERMNEMACGDGLTGIFKDGVIGFVFNGKGVVGSKMVFFIQTSRKVKYI